MEKQKVIEDIKYKIITQYYKPGEAMKEKDLMEDYNIGRTPLREALINLKNEGFVNIISKQGTFVSPIDIYEFKNIIKIRKNLEKLALELAIDMINSDQLNCLSEILEKIKKIMDKDPYNFEEYWKYEALFHNTIYKSTNNHLLYEFLKKLQLLSIRFWYFLTLNERKKISRKEYDSLLSLYEAIKEKNKLDANKIIIEHIDDFSLLRNILIGR